MGHDSDFAAYMVARWPALVRSLVLLGCAPPRAEEVVRQGLARCCLTWGRVREADDIDVEVYRAVLDALGRDSSAAPATTGDAAGPAPDRTDAELVRDALLDALDRLDHVDRGVVVLHLAAGLDARQVGELLELPAEAVEPTLADALERLDLRSVWEASR